MPAVIKGKVRPLERPPEAPSGDEGISEPILSLVLDNQQAFPPPLQQMPDEMLLGSLRDGRLKVESALMVRFSKEAKHVIAEAPDVNEFGFGQNPSAALADLQHAIAELYFSLEEEQDRLGTDLQEVWHRLQEKIQKR